jgi:hypothetical protein
MEALNLEIHKPLAIIISEEMFNLEWPFKNLPELEKRLGGRSMRTALDWFFVKPEEFRDIIAVGLKANHSTDNTDEELETLAASVAEILENDLEAAGMFRQNLMECNWPRAYAKSIEAIQNAMEMEKRGLDPKAESVDAR